MLAAAPTPLASQLSLGNGRMLTMLGVALLSARMLQYVCGILIVCRTLAQAYGEQNVGNCCDTCAKANSSIGATKVVIGCGAAPPSCV